MISPAPPRACWQPWKSGMIDLAPHHLEKIRTVLRQHVPLCEVRAFGSRVNWTAKDYSDLDLTVVGSGKLSDDTLRHLREAFEESDLPFRVDVLDWHAISPDFQKVIEKQYEVVQKARNGDEAAEPLVGTLLEGWEYTTLGEACARSGGDVQTGPFGSQLHASDYVLQGIPSIMPQNIGDNRVVQEGIARITLQHAERLSRYRVRRGDIVYSRRGDVEKRALIREQEEGWLCGTGCLRVRFGDGTISPVYASYYLGDPRVREWVVRHAHGATMPNLNTEILSHLPFVVPPVPEQHAIAHILGTLDDKIELNRRMNETLEAIARALFKSWFVDFDPVRARAEGRDPGLPKPLADKFPDSFEGSKLGPIPKGWGVGALGEHFEAIRGVSYQGSGLADSGLPMHNLNSVYEGGGYKYEGLKYYDGEYREQHIAQPGDVIVANTEQGHDRLLIGYAAIVPRQFAHGIFSHHIYRLRPRTQSYLTSQFLNCLLNWPTMHDIVSGFANGTTVNMLPIDGVQKPEFVMPPKAIISHFDAFATHAQERAECSVQQSSVLAVLRDTLLPKLISGEIRAKA
jgi:type I restriction enzyme S subunit